MTSPERRHDVVLRRRVRTSQFIEMPEAPPHRKPHGVRERAKAFTLVLIGVMVTGTTLLSTPVTTSSGNRTPVVDAFFTSVSAVAVTGLVTVDTGTHWNWLGQLVILALIQLGGLGFMVGAGLFFHALRGSRTSLHETLYIREGSPSLALEQAVSLVRHITIFTFAVEGVGWILLTAHFWREMPLGSALWHGLFHSVSAFCNAGFDLQGDFRSLTGHGDSVLVNATVMLLIQAGSLSFLVFRDVYAVIVSRFTSHVRQGLQLDTKLVLTGNAILVLTGVLAMLAIEWHGMLARFSVHGKIMAAAFQSVSARTAGYSTVDWAGAHTLTDFVWLVLMMIGGASGSAAGGVKITTVAVVVVAMLSTFRGEDETEVFQRRISTSLLMRAVSVIGVFLAIHFAGTVLLTASEEFGGTEEAAFIALMYETMSALATVGLSTGITPDLTTAGKLVLCVLMFTGRLGPLTLAYALQRRSQKRSYRYAPGEVRLG
ncbi:MAG: TrkH family potassium uptake protein [Thermomicrobiales bacterium]